MVYYSGQAPCWAPRPHGATPGRRIRYNQATHFYETVGDGAPPSAYRTWQEAATSGYPGAARSGDRSGPG